MYHCLVNLYPACPGVNFRITTTHVREGANSDYDGDKGDDDSSDSKPEDSFFIARCTEPVDYVMQRPSKRGSTSDCSGNCNRLRRILSL